MRFSRMGATLFELLLTLSMLSVLCSIALPNLQSGLDALAVRSARESAFALFSRARVLALQHGGAVVEVDATEDRIRIARADGTIEAEIAYAAHNVDLRLDGAQQAVSLRYDAHGIGRVMSRTLKFGVRTAQAGLTVSSYGRVRRW